MILKEHIIELADQFLEGRDLFIVKLTVSSDNKINIFVDGDSGVTIDDCVGLSRTVEHQLDREEEDFELNVSSAGIDHPFVLLRQYQKYIDRLVVVQLNDGTKKKGFLISADDEKIVIAEGKKDKNKKSKKLIAGEPLTILMSDIAQTKALIIF